MICDMIRYDTRYDTRNITWYANLTPDPRVVFSLGYIYGGISSFRPDQQKKNTAVKMSSQKTLEHCPPCDVRGLSPASYYSNIELELRGSRSVHRKMGGKKENVADPESAKKKT